MDVYGASSTATYALAPAFGRPAMISIRLHREQRRLPKRTTFAHLPSGHAGAYSGAHQRFTEPISAMTGNLRRFVRQHADCPAGRRLWHDHAPMASGQPCAASRRAEISGERCEILDCVCTGQRSAMSVERFDPGFWERNPARSRCHRPCGDAVRAPSAHARADLGRSMTMASGIEILPCQAMITRLINVAGVSTM